MLVEGRGGAGAGPALGAPTCVSRGRGMAFMGVVDHPHLPPQVVGYRVEEREVDVLPIEMAAKTSPRRFAHEGVPAVVHGVTQTRNRPRVLNDNRSRSRRCQS